MTTTRESISRQMQRNFPDMDAADRDGLVDYEMLGIENVERCDRTRWCECGDEGFAASSYYRTLDGFHGWFHDPAMGGCGGLTQTG